MYSFANLEQVCCSMSSSDCCFLTEISQAADKVFRYSHLFKNFPEFVVIHTVKGFSVDNKAEVDVSLELFCFFYDRMDVGNLISGSSALSKSSLDMWKFTVPILLKTVWRILSITLLACEMSVVAWSFFRIAFLWDWNENWPFPVLWPLLSFPNLLEYWMQHFHSLIF